MSEENKAVARRWFQEVWNERKAGSIADLMAEDAPCSAGAQRIVGPAAWKRTFWEPLMGAFGRVEVTVEDMIAEGDAVAIRWRAALEHTGPALGVPPTGRTIEATGLTMMVVRGGRIVEGWDGWDSTGLLVNVGAAQVTASLE
jgi:predicted ester cyclase